MTLRLSSFTEWPHRRREFRRNPLTDFGDTFDHRQTNEQTNATELFNALLAEDFGALFFFYLTIMMFTRTACLLRLC